MRKSFFLSLNLFFCFAALYAQQGELRTLNELINKEDPGWVLVEEWMKVATNKVTVLPKDSLRADKALLQAQVTTRSPMGAIIYETGGILIDNGWIRILGSGSKQLDRSLMEWNTGKAYKKIGEQPTFLLVADDVLGGFFAINAGGIASSDIGKVFYFAPDNLQWNPLGLEYSDFIVFCFSGDIQKFYEGFYWEGWKKDLLTIDGNQGVYCFPPLNTVEGQDINKVKRQTVPIQELWDLYFRKK